MRPTCPKCKSADVVPVVYGDTSDELKRLGAAGLVVLGEGYVPNFYGREQLWQCKNCKNQFRTPRAFLGISV